MTQIKSDRWTTDASTGCWNWLLSTSRDGYGYTWSGERGRNLLAHRWSYEYHVGPIPDGMTVDHRCFNPRCVNPEHLRLLTPEENRANQRSAMKAHCVNGHEFTPENTRTWGPTGRRGCRTCARAAAKRQRTRLKAARAARKASY